MNKITYFKSKEQKREIEQKRSMHALDDDMKILRVLTQYPN